MAKKSKIRIPIAAKLIFVTVLMIVATVAPIAIHNSRVFETTFGRSQDETNSELANSKAIEVDGVFMKYAEKITLVSDLLLQDFGDETQRRKALDLAFVRDLDLVNLEVYKVHGDQTELYRRETNEAHLRSYDQDRSYIERLRKEVPLKLSDIQAVDKADSVQASRLHLRNSTLAKGIPLLTMTIGFTDDAGHLEHVVLADIRLDRLQKSFSLGGARTLYLVDSSGFVLAHSNEHAALTNLDLHASPIVQQALTQGKIATRGRKPSFVDPESGEKMVGAYARTGLGPTVVVETPEAIALEPARLLRRSTISDAMQVFWVVLFFVFMFSYTFTIPIEKLHQVALEVARGNFNVKARVNSQDEVEELAEGFNAMVDGLKERDKVKNILNKFHGSSITEDLLKSNLNLGGSKKEVTVFFSDIRDFTKFSEGHTPEEVVEMLNEYFQIMVSIIVKNGGIVDKFVGDAIMAVWGAPKSTGDDCGCAVRASLEMRIALNKLNEIRIGRGHTALKIGMGLHAGPAISGTIGSTERMEYTVIGDAVNMASRIEASTKAFGADLLVSETVANAVGTQFQLELAGSAEVKGKADAVRMYKVRGRIDANGHFEEVKTPYSDYPPEEAGKVKVVENQAT